MLLLAGYLIVPSGETCEASQHDHLSAVYVSGEDVQITLPVPADVPWVWCPHCSRAMRISPEQGRS